MFPGADGTALRSHESTCLSPGFGAKEGQAAFRNSPDFPRNRENEVSGIPYLSRSPPMSPTQIIGRFVSGPSGSASNPISREGRIHGDTKFSMKKTGRRIVYGRPFSRIYSSISNLLSK